MQLVIITCISFRFIALNLLSLHAAESTNGNDRYEQYGSPECMVSSGQRGDSITLLPDALRRAAWSPPSPSPSPSAPDGTPQLKIIMLSSCDHHCLVALLPLFLSFLDQPLDNQPSLTRHLVLIAMGEEAHAICRGQALARGPYGHQCLLDHTIENKTCWPKPPPDVQLLTDTQMLEGRMGFKKMKYFLSLLQKIRWSVLSLHLGYSVFWIDLDVTLYRSPFAFWVNSLPKDVDFAIGSELWTPGAEFRASLSTCLVGKQFEGCKEGKAGEADLNSNFCCDYSPNGGLWMARSSPGGIQLLESWLALYLIHGVVGEKKAFGPEAPLDQDTLLDVIRNREHFKSNPIPLYQYSGGSYSESGRLNCSLPIVIHIISGYIATSHCWTGGNERPCGLYRNTQFGELCRNSGSYELNHLTCKLPPGQYEKLLSYHHTCLHGLHLKQLFMSMRRNITWQT